MILCYADRVCIAGHVVALRRPGSNTFPTVTCYEMPQPRPNTTMPKYKVGDYVMVKLSGGRLVQATIKAIVETTRACACRCHLETKQPKYFCGRLLRRVVETSLVFPHLVHDVMRG
jgi:hypothetical protein